MVLKKCDCGYIKEFNNSFIVLDSSCPDCGSNGLSNWKDINQTQQQPQTISQSNTNYKNNNGLGLKLFLILIVIFILGIIYFVGGI